ncbi:AMP-dependent synthetase [Thalassotalea sp. 42_200_T64]|nr:AMP-dependent synthetase [Thalassotalea sp. 42_200_T64]
MNSFYDDKENQNQQQRENRLFAQLAVQLNFAKNQCPYYQKTLAEINIEHINSRALLATLPITRKSDLISLQQEQPIFAGLTAGTASIGRVFQSPGPINDPEGEGLDWWRMGRAFYAAGFRQGERVQNCLSYHLTPGGFIMDSGAKACGCVVIPAGPGQTEQQLDVIDNLKPTGYCGTPSFLKILLDKAQQQNRDVSCITKALVTGEALPEALRSELQAQGVETLQAYASADVGLIAYESAESDGLIIAEDIIVEIVRPGTQEPVLDGEVGEVVITNFNKDYPLIRFATGDLSAIKPGSSACGRTNMRIKGWLGRADQTAKIKGMFVHPIQIERVRQAHAEIAKVRLLITRENHNDCMLLQCEINSEHYSIEEAETLKSAISLSLKSITKLSGDVELLPLKQLKDDGKVIDDLRSLS